MGADSVNLTVVVVVIELGFIGTKVVEEKEEENGLVADFVVVVVVCLDSVIELGKSEIKVVVLVVVVVVVVVVVFGIIIEELGLIGIVVNDEEENGLSKV